MPIRFSAPESGDADGGRGVVVGRAAAFDFGAAAAADGQSTAGALPPSPSSPASSGAGPSDSTTASGGPAASPASSTSAQGVLELAGRMSCSHHHASSSGESRRNSAAVQAFSLAFCACSGAASLTLARPLLRRWCTSCSRWPATEIGSNATASETHAKSVCKAALPPQPVAAHRHRPSSSSRARQSLSADEFWTGSQSTSTCTKDPAPSPTIWRMSPQLESHRHSAFTAQIAATSRRWHSSEGADLPHAWSSSCSTLMVLAIDARHCPSSGSGASWMATTASDHFSRSPGSASGGASRKAIPALSMACRTCSTYSAGSARPRAAKASSCCLARPATATTPSASWHCGGFVTWTILPASSATSSACASACSASLAAAAAMAASNFCGTNSA
mmetsp:Transcript_53905/g.150576  ORF Transcript_53905/g.150576 Transcript_53905/m.150576 type:complete len:391 (-) Transcript_53905:341-1513(-)